MKVFVLFTNEDGDNSLFGPFTREQAVNFIDEKADEVADESGFAAYKNLSGGFAHVETEEEYQIARFELLSPVSSKEWISPE